MRAMQSNLSRRTLLGGAAATFTIVKPELVRGAGKEKLKAGLVGCGGRGTQAAVDLMTGDPSVELVAMADVFEDKLEGSLGRLRDPKFVGRSAERGQRPGQQSAEELVRSVTGRVKVEPDKHFVGFDSFKKLIASDVDIILLCTPPGYRPAHFEAAIDAGKHVFTEKPIATDCVGARRFLAAGKKAAEKKLTVVSGAQRHADRPYVETVEKIKNGAVGDIIALYSWYLSGPVFHAKARESRWGDMEWQHRNWYSFIWICGDQIVEQHYHNLDFMNWVMGSHPVRVVASGGRAWRRDEEPLHGDIYDHMNSDFIYPNGVRLTSHCRQYPPGPNLYRNVSDLIVGSKGKSNGLDMGSKGINPYVQEHMNLVRSIRGDGPYINETQLVAESTLTAIMGRESAYSGQEVTWEMVMNSQQDLQPKAYSYNEKMEAPKPPVPGQYRFV